MSTQRTYQALNRLLTIVHRSLPQYLMYAMPWTHRGDEKAVQTLRHIVDDQKQLEARIADHILKQGPVDMGEYPLDFPDTHGLAMDYLLKKLVRCQKLDVAKRTASPLARNRSRRPAFDPSPCTSVG